MKVNKKNNINIKSNNKSNSKKKLFNVKTKKLVAFVCVALIVTVISLLIVNLITIQKYKYYSDKMTILNYSNLYNNQKATSKEKVTNYEMIKVIIGSLKNQQDIASNYYLNKEMSDTQKWLQFSTEMEINTVVNNENIDSRAKKMDAVIMIIRTLENLIGQTVEQTPLKISENKLKNFSKDEIEAISKAITLGIIENKNSEITNTNIIKGQLNKWVITIVEKFATVYYGSYSVDKNGDILKENVNLVLDKEKMPSNYKDYPYIVDNIDKEVYEYNYIIKTKSNFQTPVQTYNYLGYLYQQIDELFKEYFDVILNIDYTTINYDNFLRSIQSNVVYYIDKSDVKKYVDYVKQNKIKLEGEITPLLPIMYNNGEEFVVRSKIAFNIKNSNTNYNIIFGDDSSKIKYQGNSFSFYADIPTGMTLNSNSLRILIRPLANSIVSENSNIIIEK